MITHSSTSTLISLILLSYGTICLIILYPVSHWVHALYTHFKYSVHYRYKTRQNLLTMLGKDENATQLTPVKPPLSSDFVIPQSIV